jgi:hypothetical protein
MSTEPITLSRVLTDIYENWGTLASLAANVLILINRKKIPKWENDFRNRKIRTDFKQGVNELEKQAKRVKKSVTGGGFVPATEADLDFSQQEQRDILLEAWGALKQNVFNACTVNRISVTQSTGILDAVRLLRTENIIGADIALLIKMLFNYGEKIASAKFLIPPESEARSYISSAFFVLDWIKRNILTPPPLKPTAKKELPPRSTVVGASFPKPQSGHPTALLVGIRGNLQGQRFSIDKENYRIGSNPDNDLYIKGDDYLSGNHAYLSYQKGSLFLIDQDSRNGSFLNDQQVSKTPSVVRHGDHLRLGESVFEVTETSGPAKNHLDDDDEVPKPSSRPPTVVE